MALNNPKPKFINGSLYPNAKMTPTTDYDAYAGPNVNKTSILSTASVSVTGPKVKQNLGAGPKGQRSKEQIKKVKFKGLF